MNQKYERGDARNGSRTLLKTSVSGAALLITSMLHGTAFAQETTAGDAEADASDRRLGTVMVTAAKREQTTQDIPYNITALGGDALEDNRIGNLADISQSISGLAYINQGDTSRNLNSRYSLRGLNANGPGIIGWFADLSVSPVSTYVGDHPIDFPLTLNDLQRVEVLRGPQGTLYGSGSLGGTLRFIPNEPVIGEYTASASAETSFTENSDETNYKIDGVVNFPLGEQAALRIGAGIKANGGYIDAKGLVQREDPIDVFSAPVAAPNTANPLANNGGFVLLPEQEDINDSEVAYFRAGLKFQPTDRWEIDLGYHREEIESDSQSVINPNQESVTFTNSSQQLPGALLTNAGSLGNADGIHGPDALTTFPGTDTFENLAPHLTPSEYEIDLFTLDIEHDMGFATITSATSLSQVEGEEVLDSTGTWINPVGPPPPGSGRAFASYYGQFPRMTLPFRNTHDKESFTQELRLVSTWDESWDYVVGFYYTKQENAFTYEQRIPGLTVWANEPFNYLGARWTDSPSNTYATQFDSPFASDRDWEFEEYALFGELTYYINDRWQITGGARAFTQEFENNLAQRLATCGASCSATGTDPTGLTTASQSSEEEDVIFKLNTSYDVSDDHMIYFNWAEGFRRGGSNNIPMTGLLASREEFTTFEPDKASNFEIGAKGYLSDRIQYSAAAYFVDWSNVQLDAGNSAGIGYVLNIGDAESIGAELELNGELTDNLSFQLAYAYTDSAITEPELIEDIGFFGFGTFFPFQSEPNQQFPGTVEHSASWAADYRLPVTQSADLIFHVNGSYRSDTESTFQSQISADFRNQFTIESFTMWDASVTLEKDNWRASLFVDNLGDELGITGGLPSNRSLDTYREFFHARPRTFGVRLAADIF